MTAGGYVPLRRSQGTVSLEGAVLILAALYIGVFALFPLTRLLWEAFSAGKSGEPLGLLLDQWKSPSTQRALWHTIEVSVLSVIVSVILGTGIALAIVLTDVRAKALATFTLMLPMLIPPQITALAWVELMAPSSALMSLFGLAAEPGTTNPLYSREGIILVMGIEHAPLVYLAIRAGLNSVPSDLVESARLAGAAPGRVLWSIILPLMVPAILAGITLSFISSIANFGTPAVLGIPGRYPVLTTLIYQRLQGFGASALGETAALSLILAVLAIIGLAIRAWLAGRMASKTDMSSARFQGFSLGVWRMPVSTILWSLLMVISILPLVALFSASISKAIGVPLDFVTATLDHYRLVLSSEAVVRAFSNSFMLAIITSVASISIALPIAYFAAVRQRPFARALEMIADLPYAVPGTVVAIGVILVLLRPLPLIQVSLYGTMGILVFAYLARFLSLGLRPVIAGAELLDKAIDEAGQMAGAHVFRRIRSIILPVLAPAAAAGALLIFMAAFNELTVSALLWSSGNETIGVSIFMFHYEGNSPAANALACLALAVTIGLALIISLFGRYLPEGAIPWRA
ncbi:ABC transporter permease [Shinella granuli]|uniref:Iron(III) transport system permease protein n=1 Tax=Shinella granuli TaxID=323621 RepID=A0A4R2C4N7_SHIGR|nr:iron ABC transporter permease [Shinella granuli]TCN33524.1 iron(III) transport system permease protein [Shinella granuli]